MDYIQQNGGCVIYLQQEGRGIGLANKVAAYALQDTGLFDTVDANLHLGFEEDEREYDIIPSILEDMNISSIQLMTNNPRKVEYLQSLDIKVHGTIPMVVPETNPYNYKYMETKQERMRHANIAHLLQKQETQSNTIIDDNDDNDIDDDNNNMDKHNNSNKNKDHRLSFQPNMMSRRSRVSAPPVSPSKQASDSTTMMTPVVSIPEQSTTAPASNNLTTTTMTTTEGVVAGGDGYCFGRASVEAAIHAMSHGEMVVVVDDMDRENEGDFIMAADHCTPMDMAQIIRYSSGVICVALDDDRLDQLQLPAMVTNNEDPKGTAFTVTVDATKDHGITTGISATDRAKTVQLLANPTSTATDFHRPGHILPLRARCGGVLTRNGHTEAAIDLAKLAHCQPAGVLCEIVSQENPTEMMRLPEIIRFCQEHGFVLTSIADLVQYRRDLGV